MDALFILCATRVFLVDRFRGLRQDAELRGAWRSAAALNKNQLRNSQGGMGERLSRGLQNLALRFESGCHLQLVRLNSALPDRI